MAACNFDHLERGDKRDNCGYVLETKFEWNKVYQEIIDKYGSSNFWSRPWKVSDD